VNALPLFTQALSETWRAVVGWSIGIAATIVLYVPLYPSLKSEDIQSLMDNLPPELVNALGYSLTTGAGYVESTYFAMMGFLLVSIAGISWGTAAVAGDEESGALELTLAHSVTRTRLVLERTGAVFVRLFVLVAFGSMLVLAFNDLSELELELSGLIAVSAALCGVALLSATTAIAVGAATGRRSFAIAAGTVVAALSYTLNAVANQSEDVEWLHGVTPFAWAFGESPLSNGADWGGLGLLFGFSTLLVAFAVFTLRRRDVGV